MTTAEVSAKLATLRETGRVWIVNNWIINVDGVFVPQVSAALQAQPPRIPDFPTVQEVCALAHDDVVTMILNVPGTASCMTPRRMSSYIYCGHVNNEFAFADLGLHPCGTRIATFTLDFVFRPSSSVRNFTTTTICSGYQLNESAMLAESKVLRKKFQQLVDAKRILILREDVPSLTTSRTFIINVDGVYVPQLRDAVQATGTIALDQLPTAEDVVDKGCETFVSAMIMAAPETDAEWSRRSYNGMLYGRNVQARVPTPDVTGKLNPNARFTHDGYIVFERTPTPTPTQAPALSSSPLVPTPTSVPVPVPTLASAPVPTLASASASALVEEAVTLTQASDICDFIELMTGISKLLSTFRARK
jgi:hypothetical protein